MYCRLSEDCHNPQLPLPLSASISICNKLHWLKSVLCWWRAMSSDRSHSTVGLFRWIVTYFLCAMSQHCGLHWLAPLRIPPLKAERLATVQLERFWQVAMHASRILDLFLNEWMLQMCSAVLYSERRPDFSLTPHHHLQQPPPSQLSICFYMHANMHIMELLWLQWLFRW